VPVSALAKFELCNDSEVLLLWAPTPPPFNATERPIGHAIIVDASESAIFPVLRNYSQRNGQEAGPIDSNPAAGHFHGYAWTHPPVDNNDQITGFSQFQHWINYNGLNRPGFRGGCLV
jgi:hypothetical protein